MSACRLAERQYGGHRSQQLALFPRKKIERNQQTRERENRKIPTSTSTATNHGKSCAESWEKLCGTRSQSSVSLDRTFLVAIDETGSFTDCISDRIGTMEIFFSQDT
jgi:hypothetical protein